MDRNLETLSKDELYANMGRLEEEVKKQREFIANSDYKPPIEEFTKLKNLESKIFAILDEINRRHQEVFETQSP